MRVLITGGLGFVGTQLSYSLISRGHEITVIDHAPGPKPYAPKGVRYISADTTRKGAWQDELNDQDFIFNLAGASVFRKWNKDSKRLILESRVLTTRNLVDALAPRTATSLISASAVGYYGFRGDEELTEESSPGEDFLARVCVEWEREACRATEKGVRVVITRFGIVLGRAGGALREMLSAFEKYVGGPLGSGNQWFSWIHMEDLIRALVFLMHHTEINGPVNCCAPNPVRNKDLASSLGKVLNRPSFVPTPSFLLRMALGEFATVLVEGQRVVPKILMQNAFGFKYPRLPEALENALAVDQIKSDK